MTIKKLPMEVATSVREGTVMVDRHWVVDDEGLYWWARDEKSRSWAPQCNVNGAITERLRADLYPDARVELIPAVYPGPWSETFGFNPWRTT